MAKYPSLYTKDIDRDIEWQITPLFCKTLLASFIDDSICKKLKNETKNIDWLIDDINSGENGAVSKRRDILQQNTELNEYFINRCSSAIKMLGYDIDIQITTSWFTKTNKNGNCLEHTHCNSWYSCVVYFDEYNKDSSKIQFLEDSSQIMVEPKVYNFINSTKWTVDPQYGMFLIFPSGTRHKVLTGINTKIRYSLAFNIMPRGKTGKFDSSFVY